MVAPARTAELQKLLVDTLGFREFIVIKKAIEYIREFLRTMTAVGQSA